MRLDKYLANMGLGTRSQVRKIIKDGRVTVNGYIVYSSKTQVDEQNDEVMADKELLSYQNFFYYMMNKPQDVISATNDDSQKTVMDLLTKEDQKKSMFPVGRLDKDTTGLLIITNDGKLSHRLLSPAHHVSKVYEVKVAGVIDDEAQASLAAGITLKNGEQTKGAKVQVLKSNEKNSWIRLTISEGKYHQIKRMIGALSMHVLTLKRIEMGSLKLDTDLALGEYRKLTTTEIACLKEK